MITTTMLAPASVVQDALVWTLAMSQQFLGYALPLLAIRYGHAAFEWAQGRLAWLDARQVDQKFLIALVGGFVAMKLAGAGGAQLSTGDVTKFLESDYVAMFVGLGTVALKLSRSLKSATAEAAQASSDAAVARTLVSDVRLHRGLP